MNNDPLKANYSPDLGSSLHDDFVRDILRVGRSVKSPRCTEPRMGTGKTYPLQLLVRQTNTVLHADLPSHPRLAYADIKHLTVFLSYLVPHATLFTKDRDTLDFDPVLDNARCVAADRSRRALNPSPGTYTAMPSND